MGPRMESETALEIPQKNENPSPKPRQRCVCGQSSTMEGRARSERKGFPKGAQRAEGETLGDATEWECEPAFQERNENYLKETEKTLHKPQRPNRVGILRSSNGKITDGCGVTADRICPQTGRKTPPFLFLSEGGSILRKRAANGFKF